MNFYGINYFYQMQIRLSVTIIWQLICSKLYGFKYYSKDFMHTYMVEVNIYLLVIIKPWAFICPLITCAIKSIKYMLYVARTTWLPVSRRYKRRRLS